MIALKVFRFTYNENIDIIEKIYKDKVADYMLSHLIDKKNDYKETYQNNLKAWEEFILDLDQNNAEILDNYIFNK
ncbi:MULTISPECIES: hypothetical protein [Tenacibaculum]|uniref:Uncharacterized protein n=1 Tax=Tenacibaculum finnmarkense genomovar ulcerans TaxID=2781388 RepID=A0A2I2MBK1_9FLAO|nr:MULTISPECIES: hypothetical protein [Tenacibaculum]MCD8425947.1 hypothetical protein [Tenacibaculum dicentrarchi]MBE7686454.1 hypothetical protein [Tenacibaculum piscium]MBE7688961.1 hypothetical protein [Tenacibaculum finnmarkense genomovar ulcerans]MBE7691181.1 hypothetical protein [Tenacibaculum piscium]MBE7693598.1 hypothetical protein [Tenacibaculum finnmarkense genomovar finnmarkense]